VKISDCDAVILCGGLGTRIKHLLPEGQPKCLADINGLPFLQIYMELLLEAGFESFVFSLGYGAEKIADFLVTHYFNHCQWNVEPQPLGTGGALREVMRTFDLSNEFFVMNADTVFGDLSFGWMLSQHGGVNSQIITSCKYQRKFVGAFVSDGRMRDVLEWEHRDKFNMGDLPLHAHSAVLEVGTPFLDIGTPEGLAEARERFK
jgi:NDP-sugar pyrophosphorylase family protein